MARKTIQVEDIANPLLGQIQLGGIMSTSSLVISATQRISGLFPATSLAPLIEPQAAITNMRVLSMLATFQNSTYNVTNLGTIVAQFALSATYSGTISNAAGVDILSPTISGGTATRIYGLRIRNQSGAATQNFAISTGTGDVSFGDKVTVTGSQDAIQTLIKGFSTQTANLQEWQNSSAAVLASISPTGGAVFNESGDAAGDLRAESDTEANMLFLDANGDTDGALYLGGTTNGIKINKGGELTLLGTATVYDDLRVEPIVRNASSKSPSFTNVFGGIYCYYFDDAVLASEKEVHFQVQMPHDWKEGSTVYPHVHWIPTTAGTAGQVVKWNIEYSKAKLGTAFSSTTTTITGTTIAVGAITTQYDHCLTSVGSGITMTGDTLSTVLLCRLYRNSSDAADTYTGTAGLLYIDFHYERNRMGSQTEFA